MTEPVSLSPSISATPAREEALPPLRHGWFLLGSTLLIAAFYLYCVVSIVLCSALWVAVLIMAVLGTQYGGLRTMRPYLDSLSAAIMAFARGLKLRRGAEFRVALGREEAPQLWAQVEAFSKELGVAPPREVWLEDGVSAWVQLSGVAAGQGRSKLGVGFDLLAGLSPAQARAVLAHEMAHAKHVRRGYHGFLWKGLARLRRCSAALQRGASDARQPQTSRNLSKFLGFLPRKIGDVTGRLMAACSRYDEFLADRVSAQLCGSQVCREALLAIYVLDYQSDDVSWRERLLHLDCKSGYTAWLIDRLRVPDEARRLEIESRALQHARRHEMNTHPALPDRLAALDELASATEIASSGEPENAIFWLREPDVTATKLLREIERVAAHEETKATQSLAKWMKKQSRGHTARSRQNLWVGLSCLFFGALYFFSTFWGDLDIYDHIFSWNSLAFLSLMGIGAYLLLEPRRPQVEFPIPSFGLYCAAMARETRENRARREEVHAEKERAAPEKIALEVARTEREEEKSVRRASELRALLPPDFLKPRARAHFWNAKGVEFLRKCDPQSAAHCARFSLESDSKNPDALFLHTLCASLRNRHAAHAPMDLAFEARNDFSARWMVAWANCLWGETVTGEAFLLDLTRRNPQNATLWVMLANCQSSNDKPREALSSYRRALDAAQNSERETNAETDAYRFVLAQSLSGLGLLTEAKIEFEILENARRERPLLGVDDVRLDTELLRWDLSNDDIPSAMKRADDFAGAHPAPRHRIQLANTLSGCRDVSARRAAREHYQSVLQSEFYPQVWLSLSKIAFDDGDKIKARELVLRSLDTTQPRPIDAVHPVSQLNTALAGLRAVQDAAPCTVQAFEVHFDARDTPLDGEKLSLWCLFESAEAAREAATTVFSALWPQPNSPNSPEQALEHTLEHRISHEIAPQESQPTVPVSPGIYKARWK